MKKLLLLFTLSVLTILSSCSSDDSKPPSRMTATIDGVDYVFNTFVTEKETFTVDGYTYTDIKISASVNQDPTKLITFIVEQGVTGAEASYYFTYFLNETAFEKVPGFNFLVSKSERNRVEGTFSGDVLADDGSGDSLEITNGVFDIYH